ncbi:hypothetical protein [Micromonospora sp. NPDC049171]|uniref:hypothetical protein n=1 Tax=Micromonospora sp. NPDC049171 TaxID=3155770 RepID=UPI0033E9CD2B
MTAETNGAGERWTTLRRFAGYGAALAMTPYLIVKIVWTLDGLRGDGLHDGAWSRLNWTAVNGLTVAMAAAAILLGLALGQRWGMRIPGWLILLPAWVGTGFLVPMIPILPVLALTDSGGDTAADAVVPAWEIALLSVSFAGFGLGVAVAVPLYVWQRWPQAFTDPTPARSAVEGTTWAVQRTVANLAAAVSVALGLPQIYWSLGGSVGLDQAALDHRDAQWYIWTGNSGLWALIAAGGTWAVLRRRAGAGLRTPMLLTWVASGGLFAWGSWKAIFTYAVASSFPSPEPPLTLAAQNHLGALAGAMLLVVLLLVAAHRATAEKLA